MLCRSASRAASALCCTSASGRRNRTTKEIDMCKIVKSTAGSPAVSLPRKRAHWLAVLPFAALSIAVVLSAVLPGPGFAQTPGVTATEIKIGNTVPYSGPASGYGTYGKSIAAYFKMVNDEGGINGRKIDFISYDDAYSPPKTVEMVRRLVEQDQVALLF